MTTEQIAACVRELTPEAVEERWLREAITLVKELPLTISPSGCAACSDGALYSAFDSLARELDGATIRESEANLEEWDELTSRIPHRAELRPPTDEAIGLYTVQMDAAYYVGLAMGLRLAALTLAVPSSGGVR
jgi:hypothetical protein